MGCTVVFYFLEYVSMLPIWVISILYIQTLAKLAYVTEYMHYVNDHRYFLSTNCITQIHNAIVPGTHNPVISVKINKTYLTDQNSLKLDKYARDSVSYTIPGRARMKWCNKGCCWVYTCYVGGGGMARGVNLLTPINVTSTLAVADAHPCTPFYTLSADFANHLYLYSYHLI